MLEEMLACSNSDALKTTLRGLRNFQNGLLPFASSWKASHHSSVTWSREYYKWLSRLKRHIQIGKAQPSNFSCPRGTEKLIHLFFNKQSIFAPRSENYLPFSKKSP